MKRTMHSASPLRVRILAMAALLMLLNTSLVSAWGCTGHMLVAEIAQRHLSQENRDKSLLLSEAFAESGPFPRNPDMVQTACWPDDLKSWHQYAMKPWHYVDIPYNPDNLSVISSPYVGLAVVDAAGDVAAAKAAHPSPASGARQGALQARVGATRDPQTRYVVPAPHFPPHVFRHIVEDDENGGNVVTSIRNMVVALKAHKVPMYSLTFAFANLLHFVGDVHQPLHATTMYSSKYPHGDRGGNSVKVKMDGVETNLHALWDNMCLSAKTHSLKRPLDEDDYDDIRTMADVMEDNHKFSGDLVKEVVASAMAWESHMFAINSSYADVEDGAELSKAYVSRCHDVAAARVVLAGRRLATILNDIFDQMDMDELKTARRRTETTDPTVTPWWRLW